MLRAVAVSGILMCGLTGSQVQGQPSPRAEAALASVDGTLVLIPSAGIHIQIPAPWAERHRKGGRNLHLLRTAIDKLADSEQEWDVVYSQVANAILPLENCLLHVGSEGWGPDGVSFADVQARVYVVDLTPEQVIQRVQNDGLSAARRLKHLAQEPLGPRPQTKVEVKVVEGWSVAVLSLELDFEDYYATGSVDLYCRKQGNQTAVMMFMHSLSPRTDVQAIDDMLKSFQWQPPAAAVR